MPDTDRINASDLTSRCQFHKKTDQHAGQALNEEPDGRTGLYQRLDAGIHR
jgi:hypothetical protein